MLVISPFKVLVVNYRIGSLEIHLHDVKEHLQVNYRIGSLENTLLSSI